MICRADEHYEVDRGRGSDTLVRALVCKQCGYRVSRNDVSGKAAEGPTKSGQPRYNRMRAKMVRHIHESHGRNTETHGGAR